MYAVIFTHIDLEGGKDNLRVISKHNSEQEARNGIVEHMLGYYGWQNREEYEEEYPNEIQTVLRKGFLKNTSEMGEWVDYWGVVEV